MSSSLNDSGNVDSNDSNQEDGLKSEATLVNGDSCAHEGDLDLSGELETLSLTDADLYACPCCNSEYVQPRVLSCLHVICENCLRPLLVEDCIRCPICGKVRVRPNIWIWLLAVTSEIFGFCDGGIIVKKTSECFQYYFVE